ncbi:MAG: hypothetical protein QOE86_931 [Solirubrobacteraceae bacterium]|jgi:hypothetical protein|nr:hypothetical protein [Solirubrobacteraceae bacterium]
MTPLRRPLTALLAATAALAAGAPAASASAAPAFAGFQTMPIGAGSFPGSFPAGACSSSSADGQGPTGGVEIHACGLTFIGPITQVTTVMGPTIIAASFVGSSIVSGGNVAVGP